MFVVIIKAISTRHRKNSDHRLLRSVLCLMDIILWLYYTIVRLIVVLGVVFLDYLIYLSMKESIFLKTKAVLRKNFLDWYHDYQFGDFARGARVIGKSSARSLYHAYSKYGSTIDRSFYFCICSKEP